MQSKFAKRMNMRRCLFAVKSIGLYETKQKRQITPTNNLLDGSVDTCFENNGMDHEEQDIMISRRNAPLPLQPPLHSTIP